ncbi:MAG: hypothetical protein GX307_06690 [Euryarchaeota archaeon]|nr:hypothetical protein [Euryarchaeota archaeon]
MSKPDIEEMIMKKIRGLEYTSARVCRMIMEAMKRMKKSVADIRAAVLELKVGSL